MKYSNNPNPSSEVFPDDGPDFETEVDEDVEISDAELEYLRGLTETPKPKHRYGDEDQDDLMDLIDKPED